MGYVYLIKQNGSLIVIAAIAGMTVSAIVFVWTVVTPHVAKYERILWKIDNGKEDAEVAEVLSRI